MAETLSDQFQLMYRGGVSCQMSSLDEGPAGSVVSLFSTSLHAHLKGRMHKAFNFTQTCLLFVGLIQVFALSVEILINSISHDLHFLKDYKYTVHL